MIRDLSQTEIRALHYELLLKDVINTAEKLPPFPEVAWKVMTLIRRNASIREIENVIRLDPAITLRVLALSRAPIYCRRGDVRSLQDAILILGNQRLIQVIIAASASRYFQGQISGYTVNERELWQHSVGTAFLGEQVARHIRMNKLMTIYTASLLHDIGKTVLNLYARVYLHSRLDVLQRPDHTLIETERQALGIDHEELGEKIARRWRLPSEVAVAMGYHHCPDRAPTDRDLARVVYVANLLAHQALCKPSEGGDDGETVAWEPDGDSICREFGIVGPVAERLKAELLENMDSVRSFLSQP